MRSDEFRIRADIDLDAIIFNMESMKNNIAEGTKIAAVVKSDGYGHGAVRLAREIEDLPYLWGFAVATAAEALELRDNGIKKPILILGFTPRDTYNELIENDIRPVIFTLQSAEALSNAAHKLNKKANVHIGVDVGMGRIGVTPDDKGARVVKDIASLPYLHMEGIFTHFPKADIKDKSYTLSQLGVFKDFIGRLEENGITFDIHHCSNSASIMDIREANMDMVRAGISLYGLLPSDEVSKTVALRPALALKSHIVYIKEVAPGAEISYGGTFKADRTMRIATIPVGYGDGYPRSLSNKGCVLIRGKRAKITGRVCMDQFMVDVTDIPGVSEFDEVTLVGKDGDDEITMEELAGMFEGGFNYEIPCQLTRRVERVYYRKGKVACPLS